MTAQLPFEVEESAERAERRLLSLASSSRRDDSRTRVME